jgi:DNA-binding response OmpR family regulator
VAATILIVEDEHAVARGIQYALQQEGYEVAIARSGEEGLDIATHQAPDLVVLDVRLPGMDGFEVLRRLRAAGAKMPVLVLTARDDEVDKVIGLELGADDYLTKPFGLRELMSRIKALLRRAYGDLADDAGGRVIRHRDLVIDLERRRNLRRRVPGVVQRRDQLGVHSLGPRRRVDSDGELGARVQGVLKPRELVGELARDCVRGRVGYALEPNERRADPRPQVEDGVAICLPPAPTNGALHPGAIIRAPWSSSEALRPRRGGGRCHASERCAA